MPQVNRIVTLEQFIIEGEKGSKHARGEFSQLLRDLALASRLVNREVNRAGLVDLTGAAGEINVQGEAQQKLDLFANEQFMNALRAGGVTAIVGSEEDEDAIVMSPDANYVVLMDPLDGSANIDVNIPIGTIFAIFKRVSPRGTTATLEDCLQPGRNQIAAGYVIYGSSTMLVIATYAGVNGFTLDLSLGEFYLSHPDIRIPAEAYYYSVNEGRSDQFAPELNEYLREVKVRNAASDARALAPRYVGSLVADFHRNLLKGGIFMYPGNRKKQEGKLRLGYEANPMAFICERAGGRAIDGATRILDVQPKTLHQRTPLFVGSRNEITTLQGFLVPEAVKAAAVAA